MAHTIPSMMALAPKTQELFDRLPAEFTKKQFEKMRAVWATHRKFERNIHKGDAPNRFQTVKARF